MGQFFQHPANPTTMKIGAHDQAHGRVITPSIVYQPVDDVEKTAVKGGLTAQNADPPPSNFSGNALRDEIFNGIDVHFQFGGCLGARAVAVNALQIAFVGDVDFNVTPAGVEGFAETASDPGLAADELQRIQQQSPYGDVAMPTRRFQRQSFLS